MHSFISVRLKGLKCSLLLLRVIVPPSSELIRFLRPLPSSPIHSSSTFFFFKAIILIAKQRLTAYPPLIIVRFLANCSCFHFWEFSGTPFIFSIIGITLCPVVFFSFQKKISLVILEILFCNLSKFSIYSKQVIGPSRWWFRRVVKKKRTKKSWWKWFSLPDTLILTTRRLAHYLYLVHLAMTPYYPAMTRSHIDRIRNTLKVSKQVF